MKKRFYILSLLGLCWCGAHAANVVLLADSLAIGVDVMADTASVTEPTSVTELVKEPEVTPDTTARLTPLAPVASLPPGTPVKSNHQVDPDMAVWLAAVVPGLGQIYNRQYWKLPIVYGGAMGLAYAISWNNQMYIDYRKAYVDLIDANPDSKFYENVLPKGVVIDNSNKDYYTRTIKNKQDAYQRNRDLCIIITGVLYLITMIDAYVDAQMADYDISPDLSLQVAPAVLPPNQYQQTDTSIGLRCKLKF